MQTTGSIPEPKKVTIRVLTWHPGRGGLDPDDYFTEIRLFFNIKQRRIKEFMHFFVWRSLSDVTLQSRVEDRVLIGFCLMNPY